MPTTPAAGHMVHTPGHIWLVLGDFNNTVAVNERGVEADRKYFAETGVTGSYGMYYLHNLQFLLYARMMQGRIADANKAARQISTIVRDMTTSMPEMADIFDSFITMSQVRLLRWEQVLAAPQPKPSPPAAALWRHARALAFIATNNSPAAPREQSEFERLLGTLARSQPWSTSKLGDV